MIEHADYEYAQGKPTDVLPYDDASSPKTKITMRPEERSSPTSQSPTRR